MNSSVTAFSRGGRRRVRLGLTLLLPAVATGAAWSAGASLPYLRYIGPPPLRFEEARPPPELLARPPQGGPPKTSEKSTSTLNRAPEPAKVAAAHPAALASPAGKAEVLSAGKSSARPDVPAGPAPLLPDEAGAKVRPEDFLPFFQFPDGHNPEPNAAAVPAPPSPGILPPSSATYQLSK